MRRYLSLALSLAGLIFAVYWVVASARKPSASTPLIPPATSRFAQTIAGAGIIESAGRNISLAPPIPGRVMAVFVKESDAVKRGARLYQVDDRDYRAKLLSADAGIARAEAAIATAQAEVNHQQAVEQQILAGVEEAEARLADAEQIWERNRRLRESGDLAERDYVTSLKGRDAARARLDAARAQVAQAKALASSASARLREAEANLKSLRAERDEIKVILERLVVTAPQSGRILQVNVRPGEYVSSTSSPPSILFGETDTLQIRVDVDEVNAPRVRPGARAEAHPKGDATKTILLEFERIDPYILPKRSLTGDNTERVDVRVLQVIYRFRPPSFPVYVGQQVDIFIDAGADDR